MSWSLSLGRRDSERYLHPARSSFTIIGKSRTRPSSICQSRPANNGYTTNTVSTSSGGPRWVNDIIIEAVSCVADRLVSEAKTLRKEIARIAADYDIEWKGELENLANDARPLSHRLNSANDHTRATDKSHRNEPITATASTSEGGEKKIDIDKTIDEADELANESEVKRNKEKAAQRKGEVIDERDDSGLGKKEREESEKLGQARGHEQVGENRKKFD